MFKLFLSLLKALNLQNQAPDLRNQEVDREADIVRDVHPDRAGQALLDGVYWRCRTTGNAPIGAGQRVRVLYREATTLWVLPI